MVSFNNEGKLIIHTEESSETYAYLLKGLVHVLESSITEDEGRNVDALYFTFQLLKSMLPNEHQTPLLDTLNLKNTPTGK
jgi:hypothetical protein